MHLPSNRSADHIHDEPLGFVFFFWFKDKKQKNPEFTEEDD